MENLRIQVIGLHGSCLDLEEFLEFSVSISAKPSVIFPRHACCCGVDLLWLERLEKNAKMLMGESGGVSVVYKSI